MSLFGSQKLFGGTSGSPFGTTQTSTAPAASTGFTGFGFNTPNPTVANQSPFMSSQPTTSASLFGMSTSTSSLFPAFGVSTPKTTSSLFSTGFSSTAAQSTGLFSLQQPLTTVSSFKPFQAPGSLLPAQPALQVALPNQQATLDAFFASLCQPLLFGDERDTIIARWNQLQAMWGTGVGFCSLGVSPYTAENPFARFKAIAYNQLPTSTDADGLVCLYLAGPFSEVMPQKQGLQDILFRLLGGRPNLQLVIEEIRPCTENESQTEVVLKVVERQPTGSLVNISASELEKYLSSPTVAPQLQSQLRVCKLVSEVRPSGTQLAAYREYPPAGIDRLIWQQAFVDNPNPDRTIPVPLIGFADLKRRKMDQIAFGKQQRQTLKQLSDTLRQLKSGQTTLSQKVAQLKRKQVEISHRVLKVVRRQEVHRRSGFAISAEEEALRCGLERIWSQLTSPRGLRVRLHEIQSSLRSTAASSGTSDLTSGSSSSSSLNRRTEESITNWNLDANTWAELKEYLTQRQSGIRELQFLVNEMSATLKVMEDDPLDAKAVGSNLPLLIRPRASQNKVSFALNALAH